MKKMFVALLMMFTLNAFAEENWKQSMVSDVDVLVFKDTSIEEHVRGNISTRKEEFIQLKKESMFNYIVKDFSDCSLSSKKKSKKDLSFVADCPDGEKVIFKLSQISNGLYVGSLDTTVNNEAFFAKYKSKIVIEKLFELQ